MFITELSIRRPVVSWVMSLILIVFGLFVFWKLPVRELPSGLQPPVVQVQVDYTSASAPIIDQEVTQVLEDVIGGAEGIKNIDSKSSNGRSTIKVGTRQESNIEVLSWLNIGDIIVAEGLKKVYPRSKIKPIANGSKKTGSEWEKKSWKK